MNQNKRRWVRYQTDLLNKLNRFNQGTSIFLNEKLKILRLQLNPTKLQTMRSHMR